MVEKIAFVEFDCNFLQKSFYWLSDSEVKRLTETPDITLDKQEQWFQALPQKEDYFIRGILADGVPIGAVGIKNIRFMQGEYWGYIGEKAYWGKGIGKVMVEEMLRVAKVVFHLDMLYLKVLVGNARAISLYKSCGFIVDTTEGKNLRMIYKLHE